MNMAPVRAGFLVVNDGSSDSAVGEQIEPPKTPASDRQSQEASKNGQGEATSTHTTHDCTLLLRSCQESPIG